MSEDRDKLTKNDEMELEDDDVEAHKLTSPDEGEREKLTGAESGERSKLS
jgi:hypothetical protein